MVSDLAFRGRSRRPPRDPINACLSFGYVMLGNVIESELWRCGLDPLLGFLHQPQANRPSLALDVLEEMRPFVDGLVLRLVNRRQLGPSDFAAQAVPLEEVLAAPDGEVGDEASLEPTAEGEGGPAGGIYLNATGRKIFLQEFYARLREELYYPPRQGTYAWREIIREQGYHLARVIEGQEPGYQPFVPS